MISLCLAITYRVITLLCLVPAVHCNQLTLTFEAHAYKAFNLHYNNTRSYLSMNHSGIANYVQ